MAAPAKYMFDMDFAAPDKTREKAPTAADIAQKVANAEAKAYRDGFDAAQREYRVKEVAMRAIISNGDALALHLIDGQGHRFTKRLALRNEIADGFSLRPRRCKDISTNISIHEP